MKWSVVMQGIGEGMVASKCVPRSNVDIVMIEMM